MRLQTSIVVALGLGLLGACSFEGPSNVTGDPSASCSMAPTYSELVNQDADEITRGSDRVELFGDLPDDPRNTLEISLWANQGIFEGGNYATGTFEAGSELPYGDCGLCVVLWLDYSRRFNTHSKVLAAQAGMVQIDDVTNNLTGELIDVLFSEIDESTGELVPDGCETTVNATFDANFNRFGGGFGGG